MKLLNLMIAEFPEPSQLSCAHVERGDIFLQRGRVDEALAEYRKAIAQERVHPEARTQCWLSFGWTAVMHHRTELYDEAERMLSELRFARHQRRIRDFVIIRILAWSQVTRATFVGSLRRY